MGWRTDGAAMIEIDDAATAKLVTKVTIHENVDRDLYKVLDALPARQRGDMIRQLCRQGLESRGDPKTDRTPAMRVDCARSEIAEFDPSQLSGLIAIG